jgi:dihydrofolate reductase
MRKIIVQEFLTLDGVMQAPGGPEEDESGSFEYGGWTAPFFGVVNQEADKYMAKWMQSTDILLGRKTFDIFAAYWPEHADMWPGIQEVSKYIASHELSENTTKWHNVSFLNDIDAIKRLKESDGPDLKVHGSGNFAQTLFEHDLVDELQLMTFPITLGKGKRLFADGTAARTFAMTDSFVTSNGVIFATYKRAGDVKVGVVGG